MAWRYGECRTVGFQSACQRALEPTSIRRLVIRTSPRICVHSETMLPTTCPHLRSEERRVGKEGRSRWPPYHFKKKERAGRREYAVHIYGARFPHTTPRRGEL